MLERWAIGIVISFILRQLAKFEKTIDWDKVKADADLRVRQLVPGTWFDDEAVAIVNLILDRAAEVLAQGEAIEVILKLLGEQKWNEAVIALKDLLLGGFVPAPKINKKTGEKTQPEGVAPWAPEGAKMVKTANGLAAIGEGVADRAWKALKAV